MTRTDLLRAAGLGLRGLPLLFLAMVLTLFATLAPHFLTSANLLAILTQSSWLIVVALGVNFVLLAAGVDLSVGAVMYLSAVIIGLLLPGLPLWLWPLGALAVGATAGGINGLLSAKGRLPAFVATLAMAFILRGMGLYLSGTQMVIADTRVADLGRAHVAGFSVPLLFACVVVALCWVLLRATPLGLFIKALGADAEGARRAGIPVRTTLMIAYGLSGALAGLGGFLSFSQTSAATAAFGLNAEFLAIAAAVLGGTSLFGGRGNLWAPVIGAILIMTVQNGLVLSDANPYAYPVVTGVVIFLAALLDSLRARLVDRVERRHILRLEEGL